MQDDLANAVTLTGTITAVTPDPGGTIYTVEYADAGLLYFERRKIQENKGVIEFLKTIQDASGAYDITYRLE